MSKSAIPKKKSSKHKKNSELILDGKDAALTDITKYLLKQPTWEEEGVTKIASVPCPNDASLPCSTFQDKSPDNKTHSSYLLSKDSCSKVSSENSMNTERKIVSNPSVSKKTTKKLIVSNRNSHITDFFQVRRSNRKTSLIKLNEKNHMIESEILSGKEEGFEVKEFPDKGRGVISTKPFKRGDFIMEYSGELIDYEEAKKREVIYSDKENCGCYMYYFNFQNKQYCIDATKETERLGRLINHAKKGNLKTRTFVIKGKPHLVFFAVRDIEPGEELSYDYGDRRRTVLESYPWLAS